MGPGFVFAFLAIGLALVGVIGYLGYLSAKKRREEFAAVAAQRGWSYTARDDSWADRFDGAPFGLGHNRQAHNILRGHHDGRDFAAFDYRYDTTESSTDAQGRHTSHEETHAYSIVGISTQAQFPGLRVTPEGMLSRFFGRVTGKDIELESEQFNRAFTVTCEDRKFATDVLHPQMMEYLLTLPELAWDLRNATLMIATPGKHTIPQLDALLVAIDGIIDRIPEFVWKQAGITPPEPPTA